MRVGSVFVQVIGQNVKTAPAAASTANRDLTHPLATDETGGLPDMFPASRDQDNTPRRGDA